MTVFLNPDSEVRIEIKQQSKNCWVVKIGEITPHFFNSFLTIFCESEAQAKNIRKIYKGEKLTV